MYKCERGKKGSQIATINWGKSVERKGAFMFWAFQHFNRIVDEVARSFTCVKTVIIEFKVFLTKLPPSASGSTPLDFQPHLPCHLVPWMSACVGQSMLSPLLLSFFLSKTMEKWVNDNTKGSFCFDNTICTVFLTLVMHLWEAAVKWLSGNSELTELQLCCLRSFTFVYIEGVTELWSTRIFLLISSLKQLRFSAGSYSPMQKCSPSLGLSLAKLCKLRKPMVLRSDITYALLSPHSLIPSWAVGDILLLKYNWMT